MLILRKNLGWIRFWQTVMLSIMICFDKVKIRFKGRVRGYYLFQTYTVYTLFSTKMYYWDVDVLKTLLGTDTTPFLFWKYMEWLQIWPHHHWTNAVLSRPIKWLKQIAVPFGGTSSKIRDLTFNRTRKKTIGQSSRARFWNGPFSIPQSTILLDKSQCSECCIFVRSITAGIGLSFVYSN